jgi:hypothetical protein
MRHYLDPLVPPTQAAGFSVSGSFPLRCLSLLAGCAGLAFCWLASGSRALYNGYVLIFEMTLKCAVVLHAPASCDIFACLPALGDVFSLAVVNRFSSALPFPLRLLPDYPVGSQRLLSNLRFPFSLHRFSHLTTNIFLTYKIMRHSALDRQSSPLHCYVKYMSVLSEDVIDCRSYKEECLP